MQLLQHGATSIGGTTDEYFEAPYEEYPITICGQTVILTNGELAAALFKARFDEHEV